MIYDPEHWKNICRIVAEKCLPIFPDISRKKLKSEIVSNLFETQSALYFNSIGIKTTSCGTDRDPDLFFEETNTPCEIKVTGFDHPFAKKCKWMGGSFSKRTSDHIFVSWNCPSKDKILFSVFGCFVHMDEWTLIDSKRKNYYATKFESSQIFSKDYKALVGNYDGQLITLCEVV